MVTLTADAALLAILRKTTQPAEIRDADGNFAEFFSPAVDVKSINRTPEEWAELERRANAKGGRTLKEIFQRMQTLTTDEATKARLQVYIDRMVKDDECTTR